MNRPISLIYTAVHLVEKKIVVSKIAHRIGNTYPLIYLY